MPHDPSQIIAPAEVLAGEEPFNAGFGAAQPAPGTVFPSLQGGEPGDQDPGQNLGDFPFGEALGGSDLPLADVSSGSVSPAEVQRDAEQLPDSNAAILEGAASAVSQGGSVSTRKRSAEERIGQLTARYRAEQDRGNGLEEQVAQLTHVILQMQQQQASAAQFPRSSGSGEASPSVNPLTGIEQNAPGRPDAMDIRRVVNEAVAPLAQAISQANETRRKDVVHAESFARAIDDFPDLGQPGTEARTHFDKLWAVHPLRHLDDGPEQLAVLVRGVLASARRDSQAVSQRKQAAGIQVPTPSATDVVPLGSGQPAQIEQARRTAAENYRRGDRSFETYKALRIAGRARAQLRGR